ncbi:MAG: hypothetical protein DMF61_08990 [Blastocatellia bacterium AA13]|nr:MAG: hypothetical protein DMF61_08990 [Blastocatellia bacterium AA13]
MSWLANLRKWIDGDDVVTGEGDPKPRSKWEDFLVAVAREVDQTMQREMFTPPGGPTYIPREYIVFLSSADDADWQGEKREGLERGLHHVLSERARELVGDREFQTKTFTVELRVDAALETAHFRVQHVWDSQAQKTMVRARKPAPPPSEIAATKLVEPEKILNTIEADDEATVVRPRKPQTPLFSISVRRKLPDSEPAPAVAGPSAEARPAEVRPIFKNETTIGRGSKTIDVDLKLEGDLEVSRKHATLIKRDDGVYTITCHGANSIEIQPNREAPTGESADVKPGEKIVISTYELEIVE